MIFVSEYGFIFQPGGVSGMGKDKGAVVLYLLLCCDCLPLLCPVSSCIIYSILLPNLIYIKLFNLQSSRLLVIEWQLIFSFKSLMNFKKCLVMSEWRCINEFNFVKFVIDFIVHVKFCHELLSAHKLLCTDCVLTFIYSR